MTQQFEIQLHSPMGWIKAIADLNTNGSELSGSAKLLGQTVPLTSCTCEENHYHFTASPQLPFGVLEVTIDADIAADGTVTGTANAPHHRPMEIKGSRIAA